MQHAKMGLVEIVESLRVRVREIIKGFFRVKVSYEVKGDLGTAKVHEDALCECESNSGRTAYKRNWGYKMRDIVWW
jgi:hypothetical protein